MKSRVAMLKGFVLGVALVACVAAAQDKAATKDAAKPEMIAPHPVVHFEIGCKDSKKTQDFYASLFGWKIAQAGPAAMIDAGGGIAGHITALGHEPNNYTIFYVEVEDVQAYLDKAAVLGGKTLVPPVNIPTGTFAWMQDPEGNMVGLWKTKK
jgi:predicted enzyme related to lactoylglutathione lyase